MKRNATPIASCIIVVGVLTAGGCTSSHTPAAKQANVRVRYHTWSDVTRGDVTKLVPYDGTVVPFNTVTLQSAAAGTITRLPGVGSTISAGQPLFLVDEKPVIAVPGDVPVYRDLLTPTTVPPSTSESSSAPAPRPASTDGARDTSSKAGATPTAPVASTSAVSLEGGDVAQLEQFLASAGTYSGKVDGQFGPAVATAAQRWRKGHGLGDGRGFARSELVFLPGGGPWTVTKTEVAVGQDFGGGPVLDVSSTAPAVQVSLDAPPPADVSYSIAADPASGRPATALSASGGAVRDDSGKYVQTLTVSGLPPAGGLAVGTALVIEQTQLLAHDALSVPVAAVRLDATGSAVLACRSGPRGDPRTCHVALGATNGTDVVVTHGIQAGDQVAVAP